MKILNVLITTFKNTILAAVGFEPTPPKRLVPKTSALDHSATLPCRVLIPISLFLRWLLPFDRKFTIFARNHLTLCSRCWEMYLRLYISFTLPFKRGAQEIARRLIECSHARKSLVKGERFVRFARKPEWFLNCYSNWVMSTLNSRKVASWISIKVHFLLWLPVAKQTSRSHRDSNSSRRIQSPEC